MSYLSPGYKHDIIAVVHRVIGMASWQILTVRILLLLHVKLKASHRVSPLTYDLLISVVLAMELHSNFGFPLKSPILSYPRSFNFKCNTSHTLIQLTSTIPIGTTKVYFLRK